LLFNEEDVIINEFQSWMLTLTSKVSKDSQGSPGIEHKIPKCGALFKNHGTPRF